MNGHHHNGHHKKEEGNGKYIAGIVISILVIIAAIGIAVWTVAGGFGGQDGKSVNESGHASDLEIGADDETGAGESDDAADADASGGGDDTSGANEETGGSGQNETDARVQELLAGMTLEEKVCQLFMITPEALTGVETATQAGQATQNAYNEYPVGGIIYFSKNLKNPDQTRTMLNNTQQYAKERTGLPVFLSVDEEGGQVARVGRNSAFGVEKIGNMSDVGASGDTQEAYRIGTVIGSYLKDLGFNMDAAPDTDVLTNPQNEVVKYRSFGSDPQLVADMAEAELKGLNEQGIIGMYKHFPGHGGTTADSQSAYKGVLDAVAAGTVTEERIDESVARILKVKLTM